MQYDKDQHSHYCKQCSAMTLKECCCDNPLAAELCDNCYFEYMGEEEHEERRRQENDYDNPP